MKRITFTIVCMIFKITTLFAQTDSLVMDENDKYVYYEVVSQQGSPADTLQSRAINFTKKVFAPGKLKFKALSDGKINATGGVLVQKKSTMGKHEDARIDYTMIIEVKDNRYRYWFTDFIIVPYARDRYANFVPVIGKNTPLEKGLSILSKRDLDAYNEKLFANIKDIGNRLKTYMKAPVAPVKQKVKKTTIPETNW